MARPSKKGLDYFPFDTDFFADIRIRKLIKYQGCKAVPVYTLLLCKIYESGSYMRWDKELPFIFSEITGYEEGYVQQAIDCCLKVGLFSEQMYRDYQVLTSKGIQERYVAVCRASKRSAVINEFSLINSEETRVNTEETPVNSAKSTQRKGKEIKEKEIKEDDESSSATLSNDLPDFVKANNQRLLVEEKEKDPPELRPPPLTMEEYGDRLRASRQYVEAACMSRKVSEQEFNQALTEFVAEKSALGHLSKDFKDAGQHFLNYLQIWQQKQSRDRFEGKVGGKPAGKIRQTVEAAVESDKVIEEQGGYFTYDEFRK